MTTFLILAGLALFLVGRFLHHWAMAWAHAPLSRLYLFRICVMALSGWAMIGLAVWLAVTVVRRMIAGV